MRFLFVADNHLRNDSENEPTDRLKWGLSALRKVHNYAKEEGIEVILHGGDFFDVAKPKALTFQQAVSLFWEFYEDDEDIRWYFLAGNHDIISSRAGTSYLGVLAEVLPNAGLMGGSSRGGPFQMDNIFFMAVPYSTQLRMNNQACKAVESKPKDLTKVLVTHATFKGVMQDGWRSPTGLIAHKGSPLFKYDLILTGHFHSHQTIGNKVVYPGSLHPLDFTPDMKTGFLDVIVNEDLTWNIKHIPVEEPTHKVVKRTTKNMEKLIERGQEDVDGCYLKIAVNGTPSELEATRALREELEGELRAMGALGVRWQLDPEVDRESRIKFTSKTRMPEIVEQHVENSDTKLNKGRLMRMGVEYLT